MPFITKGVLILEHEKKFVFDKLSRFVTVFLYSVLGPPSLVPHTLTVSFFLCSSRTKHTRQVEFP